MTTKHEADTPLTHPTAEVEASMLGRCTEVEARSRLSETALGDCSSVTQDGLIWAAAFGGFAPIAAAVRINATDHPTRRPTLHHSTRRAGDHVDAEAVLDRHEGRSRATPESP